MSTVVKPSFLCLMSLLLVFTSWAAAAPAYLPPKLETDDQYLSCPECYGARLSPDYAKRVKMMSVWARNGMPLSILYLKTKPNTESQSKENFQPLLLPYRANPSTRGGYNSKQYQANLSKPKLVQPTAMRRQSVVLPQMFLTYGFDNKKPFLERE